MNKQSGNTLIELLIATVIVGVMLTGIAISLTYSIQREAINRYREGATSLAVEISEYLLLKRAQENWRTFFDGLSDGVIYCYDDTIPPSFQQNPYCPVINKLGMDFNSRTTIDKTAASPGVPEKVSANIVISWQVDGDTKTYELDQEYFEREY